MRLGTVPQSHAEGGRNRTLICSKMNGRKANRFLQKAREVNRETGQKETENRPLSPFAEEGS